MNENEVVSQWLDPDEVRSLAEGLLAKTLYHKSLLTNQFLVRILRVSTGNPILLLRRFNRLVPSHPIRFLRLRQNLSQLTRRLKRTSSRSDLIRFMNNNLRLLRLPLQKSYALFWASVAASCS